MIRCFVWLFALFLSANSCVLAQTSIYEVPENSDNLLGAWDANIMADDVHFKVASIIRKISIRLAIAGVQTCQLWVFAATNSAPIYRVLFTNVPAGIHTEMGTYDFDMHLQVPKDIFVGFSAQGDGWSANDSDYWSMGTDVVQGVARTAGQYYYGSVAGEKLTTIFNSGDSSFGCLQIFAEPVRIDQVSAASGQVELTVSSLPIHATNTMERSEFVDGTNWVELEALPLGVSNHAWSATTSGAIRAFYRVTSH